MTGFRRRGFFEDFDFDWGLFPKTGKFLEKHLNSFLKRNSFAKALAKRLRAETSTFFFDWIDHIAVPEKNVSTKVLGDLGFKEQGIELLGNERFFVHPQSVFFPVVLHQKNFVEIALKPEILDDFVKSVHAGFAIEGEKFSPLRKTLVKKQGNTVLSAVERRGYKGFIVRSKTKDIERYALALNGFFFRERAFDSDTEGMVSTEKLVRGLLKKLSAPRVADAFFRADRYYWQGRNSAGQLQKFRQDRLGLGWGNHDHHTYRSSRENFASLIKIFELLGLECREAFHAGKQAGWGAQIMEQPDCNIVVFADLDLMLEEKGLDFAHQKLPAEKRLGTVGLWVGLHGESILQAGMHHLEARFDFEKLRKDLLGMGVNVMAPFSYFKFLKQAFTQGEHWSVQEKRARALLEGGSITKEQCKKFVFEGAIGSHLENLQRSQGFKGFNQDSVSAIIKATDPRMHFRKGA